MDFESEHPGKLEFKDVYYTSLNSPPNEEYIYTSKVRKQTRVTAIVRSIDVTHWFNTRSDGDSILIYLSENLIFYLILHYIWILQDN